MGVEGEKQATEGAPERPAAPLSPQGTPGGPEAKAGRRTPLFSPAARAQGASATPAELATASPQRRARPSPAPPSPGRAAPTAGAEGGARRPRLTCAVQEEPQRQAPAEGRVRRPHPQPAGPHGGRRPGRAGSTVPAAGSARRRGLAWPARPGGWGLHRERGSFLASAWPWAAPSGILARRGGLRACSGAGPGRAGC